jgi:hypothetical protein
MMKQRMILTIVLILVLLGGVVVAQPNQPDSLPLYTVETGTASGGNYQLTSLTWQVSGTASGEGYRLLCPETPTLRGSGCCCTYLPLTLRNFK